MSTPSAPAVPRPLRVAVHGGTLAGWTLRAEQGAAPERDWLVVCHGGSLDHREFLPLAQALAPRINVLLLDLPGHGQSLPMPRPCSMQHAVDAVAALMDEAGIERAVVLGFSFGGVVAQRFAAQHPQRVQAWIAYACYMPLLKPLSGAMQFVTRWTYRLTPWHALRRKCESHWVRSTAATAQVRAIQGDFDKPRFLAMAGAMMAAPPAAPPVPAPLAYLHGEHDAVATHPAISPLAALRQRHPQTQIIAVPDAAHCAHLDHPAAFLEAVTRCLDRLPSTPAAP